MEGVSVCFSSVKLLFLFLYLQVFRGDFFHYVNILFLVKLFLGDSRIDAHAYSV